ncbi:Adenylate cyclase 1 [Roseovarius litorisediminis]|uniref:Adenylate cyclase 1 n=1 Tax=Roseovarius litorisediminis TaxID=1312363 RepID=A0A1Y5SPK3_9RHOB|nr:adenylate/guanylate cyclase domain-containing protein [Roseovarius litorisediminis]SLN45084.1 Adenylate cyclase 1 [Roseovarius litorisediminis]
MTNRPALILLVDDEPDFEVLVKQHLRHQIRNGEFDFLYAENGVRALEVLQKHPDVDIVLSDINMPRMDGLTLLAHLQDIHRNLETVIVSAYGDMDNIRKAMNSGAFDFLTKPIDFTDLERTIGKTLGHLHLMRSLRAEKAIAERAKTTLSRYFSPAVVEALAEDPDYLSQSSERRVATFMFTDITGFTGLVETSSPEQIAALLNDYLAGVIDVIFKHGGTVTKIMGDSVHVIFGAPFETPDHARDAVECALAMDAFAETFRQWQAEKGIALGATRIGLNTGPATIGSFGTKDFFDYSAYGDVVNTAARVEQANKVLGTRICIGQGVVDHAGDIPRRPVGTLRLRGKTTGLNAYEPLTSEHANNPEVLAYQKAFEKLRAADPTARQAFAAIVGDGGNDPLALFHLGRLLNGQSGVEIQFGGKQFG